MDRGPSGPLLGWWSGGHDDGAVAGGDGEVPFGVEGEAPVLGVEVVVVVFAQRHEELDVGVAAVVPVDEVVGFGVRDVGVAAGDHASPVHGAQCPPLVAGRESTGAARMQRDRGDERVTELIDGRHGPALADDDARTVDDDRDEPGASGHPSQGFDREIDPAS
eukprot:gene40426-64326_t